VTDKDIDHDVVGADTVADECAESTENTVFIAYVVPGCVEAPGAKITVVVSDGCKRFGLFVSHQTDI